MKIIWHLMKKDLRRFWPLPLLLAGLWGTMLVCILSFNGSPREGLGKWGMFLQMGPLFQAILLFVIPVVVIQEDGVVGDRAAWLTRPIRPIAMLASKMLVIFFGLALPSAVLSAGAAAYLGAPVSTIAGVAINVAEVIIFSSLLVGLLAACTRTFFQSCAALLCIFVTLAAMSFFLVKGTPDVIRSSFPIWPWSVATHLTGATEYYVWHLTVAIAAIGALSYLYCRRLRIRALAGGLTFFWALSILSARWPLDFSATLPDPSVPSLTYAEITMHSADSRGIDKTSHDDVTQVTVPLRLDGVPANRSIFVHQIEVKLILMNGQELSGFIGDRNSMAAHAMESALGLPPNPQGGPWAEAGLSFPESEYEEVTGKTVSAKGVLGLTPLGYRIAHRFSLTEGLRFRTQGEEWRIPRIVETSTCTWEITVDFARIALPGRNPPVPGEQDFVLTLVNQTRNEVSIGFGRRTGRSTDLCAIDRGEISSEFSEHRARSGGAAIRGLGDDWLRAAELCILTPTEGRPVELPFVMDQLKVPTP